MKLNELLGIVLGYARSQKGTKRRDMAGSRRVKRTALSGFRTTLRRPPEVGLPKVIKNQQQRSHLVGGAICPRIIQRRDVGSVVCEFVNK